MAMFAVIFTLNRAYLNFNLGRGRVLLPRCNIERNDARCICFLSPGDPLRPKRWVYGELSRESPLHVLCIPEERYNLPQITRPFTPMATILPSLTSYG